MPRWIARILYTMRGKRRVRLHIEDKPGSPMPSIDGVLLGRWSGHYVLLLPKLVQSEERSVALEGLLEVPAERVVFVQVFGEGR
jgi:hypothetical protein